MSTLFTSLHQLSLIYHSVESISLMIYKDHLGVVFNVLVIQFVIVNSLIFYIMKVAAAAALFIEVVLLLSHRLWI